MRVIICSRRINSESLLVEVRDLWITLSSRHHMLLEIEACDIPWTRDVAYLSLVVFAYFGIYSISSPYCDAVGFNSIVTVPGLRQKWEAASG